MSYGKDDFLRWDDDDMNLDLLLGEYTCSEVELSDDETVYSTGHRQNDDRQHI